jgi:hypothetical protein
LFFNVISAHGRPEKGGDPLFQQGAASCLKTFSKGDGLNMSVPAPREPGQGGRWETIRYALDTNPRTFRLCLILAVAALAPCLGLVVAELIRHLLLRAQLGDVQHLHRSKRFITPPLIIHPL